MNEIYADLVKLSRSNPELRFEAGISKDELELYLKKYSLDTNSELEEYFGVVNGGIAGPGVLLGVNRDDNFFDIDSCKDIDDFILNSMILPIATDGSGNIYVVLLDKTDIRFGSIYFIDLHEYPIRLSYVVASSIKKFIYFIIKYDTEQPRFGWPYDKEYMMANDPVLFEKRFSHNFIWDE